jgi:hypothetical protein
MGVTTISTRPVALRSLLERVYGAVPAKLRDRMKGGRLHQLVRKGLRKRGSSLEMMESLIYSLKTDGAYDYFLRTLDCSGAEARFPLGCLVEINNTCNLDCAMCRTSLASRKKGLMDLSLFEEVVRKARDRNIPVLGIHSTGDPLANAQLERYLNILRQYGMSITLSSNCLRLNEHLDTIFAYRDTIHTLRPSIDAASKDVYERIRKGGNWEVLHKNLIAFVDRNKRLSAPFHIFVNSIISEDNFHEIAFIPHVFSYLAPPTNFSFVFVSSVSSMDSYFEAKSCFHKDYVLTHACSSPWSAFYVLVDGATSVCCQDYHGDLVFGNAMEDAFDTYGTSEYLNRIRSAIKEGHQKEALPKPCRTCFSIDPRVSMLFRLIFDYFFLVVRKHPVYLQEALNEIVVKLRQKDLDTIMDILKSLG